MTLALLLFGAAGDERGASGIPPELVPEARQSIRVHAGVAAGGFFGVANYNATGAAILALDLGMVLRDRVSLVARVDGGSAFISVVGSVSLAAQLHLNDRFSVGIGAKLGGWLPFDYAFNSRFVGVMIPLRVTFAPFTPRVDGVLARTGFVIGFEAAPGIAVLPIVVGPFGRPVDAELGLTLGLTAGYAVW